MKTNYLGTMAQSNWHIKWTITGSDSHGLDWEHAGSLRSCPCTVGCPPMYLFPIKAHGDLSKHGLIMSLPFAPGWISLSHDYFQGPADLLASSPVHLPTCWHFSLALCSPTVWSPAFPCSFSPCVFLKILVLTSWEDRLPRTLCSHVS